MKIILLLSVLIALILLGSYSGSSESQSDEPNSSTAPPLFVYFIDERGGLSVVIDSGTSEIVIFDRPRDFTVFDKLLRRYEKEPPHPAFGSSRPIIDGPIELVVLLSSDFGSRRFAQANLFRSKGKTPAAAGPPYEVREFWEPGVEDEDKQQLVQLMKRIVPPENFKRPLENFHPPSIKTGKVQPFELASIPGARFTVLSSDADAQVPPEISQLDEADVYSDDNASIVLMIEVAGIRMLFPGHIWGKLVKEPDTVEPRFTEAKLLALEQQQPGALKSTLIVAPGGGNRFASTKKFVAAVSPEFSIIHWDSLETIRRYEKPGRVFSIGAHGEAGRDNIFCTNVSQVAEWLYEDDPGLIEPRLFCGYHSLFSHSKWGPEWEGADEKGKPLLEENVSLPTRFAKQKAPLIGYDLTGMDLSKRKLAGADFAGANLSWANLAETDLTGATLHKAVLAHSYIDSKTILEMADLTEVNLSSARAPKFFNGANLSTAFMNELDLSGANFRDAVLSRAFLNNANLRSAILVRSKLDGARLSGADLTGAVFEPLPGFTPSINELTTANYLSTLTYESSPHGLVELREAFKKAGLRQQEREITYAIERNRNSTRHGFDYWFNRILFDIPCQYGMNPSRPLVILGLSIFTFAVPYSIALFTRGRGGIWAVWSPDRVEKSGADQSDPVRLTSSITWTRLPRLGGLLVWIRVILIGVYFSLISAFHIGYRDLNIGNWISRLQTREYFLRPTGWVRVVSGFQSLMSVYLLALWVLTYFGRPFE